MDVSRCQVFILYLLESLFVNDSKFRTREDPSQYFRTRKVEVGRVEVGRVLNLGGKQVT